MKLDTDVLFSEEFARLPSVAIAAFLITWAWAARQPQRGYFKSERVLREYLGPTHSRGIATLYAAGLLFRTPDRRVEAVGYAEMHEEDAELPLRMRRLRARRKAVLEALDPPSGEQDTSTFTRNEGNGGSSAFNRNESGRFTQNPVPVTQNPETEVPVARKTETEPPAPLIYYPPASASDNGAATGITVEDVVAAIAERGRTELTTEQQHLIKDRMAIDGPAMWAGWLATAPPDVTGTYDLIGYLYAQSQDRMEESTQ